MKGWTLWLAQSLQLVLGTVFLVSGATKLRSPRHFAAALRDYELIPSSLSGPASLAVIMMELLCAASLLSGHALGVAVPVATLLLVAFAAAVGVNLRRGRAVPCGCFGATSEPISVRTVTRIGMLLVAAIGLAVTLWWSGAAQGKAARLAVGELMSALTFAGFLLVSGAWLLHLPELRAVFRLARGVGRERSG